MSARASTDTDASPLDLTDVWDRYRSALTGFVRSKVSNPADAEDLLQEILIKTHNNLQTLQSYDSVKSWMMQIASRTIIDFYRTRRAPTQELPEESRQTGPDDPDTQNALAGCVGAFIDALPKDDAALLRAIDLQGQSQKAYAQLVGVNYSTLKSRTQKARNRLRAIVKNCCELSIDGRGKVIDAKPRSEQCGFCE